MLARGVHARILEIDRRCAGVAPQRTGWIAMESVSHITLSHQTGLKRQMSTLSNNIANVNTTAYREEDMMFEEVLQETQDGETGTLSFTQDVSTYYDLEQGALKKTGNPLDVAINGDGYFTVETDEGPRYTRDGAFTLDAENQLVTKEGRNVLDAQGNPIEVPENAGEIEVARDGTISTPEEDIAQLGVASFDNAQELDRLPDSLYAPGGQEPAPAENPEIHQGMLEQSNVQPIKEMTTMMKVVSSYQSTQSMMDNDHQRQLRAIRTLVGGGN
jgi:flagellar basal-body rod protein FlgF